MQANRIHCYGEAMVILEIFPSLIPRCVILLFSQAITSERKSNVRKRKGSVSRFQISRSKLYAYSIEENKCDLGNFMEN